MRGAFSPFLFERRSEFLACLEAYTTFENYSIILQNPKDLEL